MHEAWKQAVKIRQLELQIDSLRNRFDVLAQTVQQLKEEVKKEKNGNNDRRKEKR
jgi:cell division protein FtsB